MSDFGFYALRGSATFARRLIEASRGFGESNHQFYRRVNWSHRYGTRYYQTEFNCFRSGPDDYMAGRVRAAAQLEDVWALRLGFKQAAISVVKVCAHWLFYVMGRFANRRIRKRGLSIYRKGYVDDIELVFDPEEAGVLRAIYPFPMNIGRQLRYLRDLRSKGHLFKLHGTPYSPMDLLRFMLRRDVRSLMRMESRAQIRNAHEVASLGAKVVQVSDEFDLGSLDFCRTLARLRIYVINSAHGVGKYLPVHAYQEFRVITHRQIQYYHATRACRYGLRKLNDRSAPSVLPLPVEASSVIRFVFLSQSFPGFGDIIPRNEARFVQRLAAEFDGHPHVKLLYRPHPNCQQPVTPKGFDRLWRLEDVNGKPGTVFASFDSTCQIDPAFKGRKVLVRGDLIYPEVFFDESEEILDFDGLVGLLRELGAQMKQYNSRIQPSLLVEMNTQRNGTSHDDRD